MWRLSENSDIIKPEEIDEISSDAVVYIRRNFEEIERRDEEGNFIGSSWRYEENEIPKKYWEIYKEVILNEEQIKETEQMMTDLDITNLELNQRVEKLEVKQYE